MHLYGLFLKEWKMKQETAVTTLEKQCQYCGEKVGNHSLYCPNCGRSFLPEESNPFLDFLRFFLSLIFVLFLISLAIHFL